MVSFYYITHYSNDLLEQRYSENQNGLKVISIRVDIMQNWREPYHFIVMYQYLCSCLYLRPISILSEQLWNSYISQERNNDAIVSMKISLFWNSRSKNCSQIDNPKYEKFWFHINMKAERNFSHYNNDLELGFHDNNCISWFHQNIVIIWIACYFNYWLLSTNILMLPLFLSFSVMNNLKYFKK